MSEPKWTPGPWVAEQNVRPDGVAISGYGIYGPREDDPQFVADVRFSSDARLIAAAPDLIEHLEATQPLLQVAMLEAQKHGDYAFIQQLQIQFAANLTALAKAHGDNP